MGQTSDELRHEIDQHRESASAKIDQLQQQVQGTADDLKSQAEDTVEQVKDTVQGTVDDAVDKIKEIDIEGMIRERPLVALGVGLIGGMVAGGMLRGSGGSSSGHAHRTDSSSHDGGGLGESVSGLTDSIKDMFRNSGLEDAINNAAAAAMGSISSQITGVVERNFPGGTSSGDSTANKTRTSDESRTSSTTYQNRG